MSPACEEVTLYIIIANIEIKPEHREAYMEAMLDDAKGSVENEPGCLRFDVLQNREDPNKIHLYEVYRDEAAVDAHVQQPHFIKWRDTVGDWHAKPPDIFKCTNVFPSDSAWP